MAFGLSPEWDDPDAREWVEKGWCHYVIPEAYVQREVKPDNPVAFSDAVKPWWDLKRPDGSAPEVIAGLLSARVHVPRKGQHQRWEAEELLGQIDDAKALVPNGGRRKGGQAHFSWSALRSPDQAGRERDKNLGDKLKDKWAEPAAVPALR
jgi:hypothetical protein